MVMGILCNYAWWYYDNDNVDATISMQSPWAKPFNNIACQHRLALHDAYISSVVGLPTRSSLERSNLGPKSAFCNPFSRWNLITYKAEHSVTRLALSNIPRSIYEPVAQARRKRVSVASEPMWRRLGDSKIEACIHKCTSATAQYQCPVRDVVGSHLQGTHASTGTGFHESWQHSQLKRRESKKFLPRKCSPSQRSCGPGS